MASYNGDFNRMQEEALARLREMQSRSRTAVNRPKEAQSAPPPPQRQAGAQRPQHPQPQPAQRQDIFKSLFGDVKIDSEKALILLMLFVLYRNNADIKLLLALGYLLV